MRLSRRVVLVSRQDGRFFSRLDAQVFYTTLRSFGGIEEMFGFNVTEQRHFKRVAFRSSWHAIAFAVVLRLRGLVPTRSQRLLDGIIVWGGAGGKSRGRVTKRTSFTCTPVSE
jgi:hypothetical protein